MGISLEKLRDAVSKPSKSFSLVFADPSPTPLPGPVSVTTRRKHLQFFAVKSNVDVPDAEKYSWEMF